MKLIFSRRKTTSSEWSHSSSHQYSSLVFDKYKPGNSILKAKDLLLYHIRQQYWKKGAKSGTVGCSFSESNKLSSVILYHLFEIQKKAYVDSRAAIQQYKKKVYSLGGKNQ